MSFQILSAVCERLATDAEISSASYHYDESPEDSLREEAIAEVFRRLSAALRTYE